MSVTPGSVIISSMAIFDQAASQWLLPLAASTALEKVTFFFIIWAVLWLPLAIPIAIVVKWRPPQVMTTQQKLPLMVALYLVAPLILWGASWRSQTAFSSYGLDWQPNVLISLVIGFGLGVLGIAVVFAGQWRWGWIQWNSDNFQNLAGVWLPILLLGLGVGVIEELVFRGFLINQLERDYSILLAAVISSVIFALLHLVWEQENTLPQLPGLWLMGMVLVLARICDRGSLGLAWGLHAGWIWALTCLDSAALISYTGKGAVWVTGIGKNPLAGIAGLVCLLLTGAFLLLFSFRVNWLV